MAAFQVKYRILLEAAFASFFGYFLLRAQELQYASRFFPQLIALIALILTVVQLGLEFRQRSTSARFETSQRDLRPVDASSTAPAANPKILRHSHPPSEAAPVMGAAATEDEIRKSGRRGLLFFSSYLGFIGLIWFVGFAIAAPLFLCGFLILVARSRWFGVVLALVGYAAGYATLTNLTGMVLPVRGF